MTDFTPERLAELRAVAEAAFPVEDWAIWGDLKDGGFVHVGNAQGVIPEGQFVTAEDAEPNPVAKAYTPELAAHIAAFDPPTVLALIAALEGLSTTNENLVAYARKAEAALEAKTAEAQRIPLYAMLDVFHAVTGTSHPEWDRFYETHGYAESWARVLAMVRDAVLAVHDLDKIRAEVWDEGAKAAREENFMDEDFEETPNPYRKAAR